MPPRSTLPATLAVLVASLAFCSAASAEFLIPNGNSAVNQYTEGLPTAGGERNTKGGDERPVKPAKTLGADNAKKLEEKGAEGMAAAELAAETAPADVATIEVEREREDRPPEKKPAEPTQQGGDEGGPAQTADPKPPASAAGTAEGSSGLGEVSSAATGLGDTGGLGLLLPLTLIAALVWAAFGARRRSRDGERTTELP
jgi:hypothetical protein